MVSAAGEFKMKKKTNCPIMAVQINCFPNMACRDFLTHNFFRKKADEQLN